LTLGLIRFECENPDTFLDNKNAQIPKKRVGDHLDRFVHLSRCAVSTASETRRAVTLIHSEVDHLHELTGGFKAEWIIRGWMDFYNTERPHPRC